MGLPPASPGRITATVVSPGVPPPPPTYRGQFQEIDDQMTTNADARKKALWGFCSEVVTFLQTDLAQRFRSRLGAAANTNASNRDALNALSKAETALMFNLSGVQGYDASRDYEGPASRAFDYVRDGSADAFVDRVLAVFRGDPIPMPNPRANPEDYTDWAELHPLSYGGRRKKTSRRRRRGKRTYRHSTRKRQG